jgi:N-dimethylarginine dimethylaminohydrolase
MVSASPTFTAPFVGHDAGALQAALLVRPVAAIESLAPTQGEPSPIFERALEQFEGFVDALNLRGVRTVVLEPDPAQAWGMMATDCAVVLGSGAILMRPSEPVRRSDVARIETALASANIPVIGRIEAPGLLDGADILVGPDEIFVGVPVDRASSVGIARTRRGNELGRRQLAEIAERSNLRTVEVPLASEVLRLRSIAAFVDRDVIVVGSRVVDTAPFEGLVIIEAPYGEDYGAGVLALGPRRAIANVRFRTLFDELRRKKVAVDAIDLWELGKIGATPSTLALALKRA